MLHTTLQSHTPSLTLSLAASLTSPLILFLIHWLGCAHLHLLSPGLWQDSNQCWKSRVVQQVWQRGWSERTEMKWGRVKRFRFREAVRCSLSASLDVHLFSISLYGNSLNQDLILNCTADSVRHQGSAHPFLNATFRSLSSPIWISNIQIEDLQAKTLLTGSSDHLNSIKTYFKHR